MKAISSIHCNISVRNVFVSMYRDSLSILVYSKCKVTLAHSVLWNYRLYLKFVSYNFWVLHHHVCNDLQTVSHVKVQGFWDIKLCRFVRFFLDYPKDGGSKILRNTGNYLPVNMMSLSKKNHQYCCGNLKPQYII